MKRYACFLGLAALMLPACVSTDAYQRAVGENDALRKQRDDLARRQQELNQQLSTLQDQNQRLQKSAADAAWIEEQREKLNRLIAEFEQGGARPAGVTLKSTPEGFAFEVQGEVLFDSGKAEVTDKGRTVLKSLLRTLQEENKMVRVDGHTDADPIRNSPWRTNLRLSAERSLAVAQVLIDNGFPATRLAIAGFGEYRPADPGTTDLAKQANRRVEIVMLNEKGK